MRPWDGCVCGVGGPATSYGGPYPPTPKATLRQPPPVGVHPFPTEKQGHTTRTGSVIRCAG